MTGSGKMGPQHKDPEVFRRELYEELRKRAARCMADQPGHHTLQATALVHEIFLKLHAHEPSWEDRKRFLAVASKAMRQILVDHARGRGRDKRRAPGERVALDDIAVTYDDRAIDLLALEDALTRLSEVDPEMAQAVELRFFGGMSVDDTARLLGLPKRTFERRWSAVRAWLHAEVQ